MTARLAPWVTFTRLPYGAGGVLVDGRALTATECGESDADLIGALLAGARPDPAPHQRAQLADLIARSWLIPTAEER